MDNSSIIIRGAREHNLRNVHLELPRNQLIVFTGVSGSGKSSLAFDTLFAEGQRRYIESLSSYARQFLGQMPKPDVDFLAGLSPSISIQQKTAGSNPRSTVGTITEIYDYFRVLYARIGIGHCPSCDRPITAQTREQIVDRILVFPVGTRCQILAPVIRGQKGEHRDLFAEMVRRGYVRARVDGQFVQLTDNLNLDRQIKHYIEIIVDRITVDPKGRTRVAESVEQALALGDGNLLLLTENESKAWDELPISAKYACSHCNLSYEPPSPQLFSFNSPHGMCLECDGLGMRFSFDEDLLIPDPSLSFAEGTIPLVGKLSEMGSWKKVIYRSLADSTGIDLKKPWKKLPKKQRDLLLYGMKDEPVILSWKWGKKVWKQARPWEGIIPDLVSEYKRTKAKPRRMQMEKYMRRVRCNACNGQRLNAQARAVRVGGTTLVEACALPIGNLHAWFAPGGPLEASLNPIHRTIAEELLKEIRGRLQFLMDVGLHYLSLDRAAPTLSGGEAQRIRLAGQIGCGLVGVLYILDEPSIGLHPRDNSRLMQSLERLRDLGNTVLVVEHDEETIRAANHVVDFGPGPGVRGGEVVATGTLHELLNNPNSLTGKYLSGVEEIAIPRQRRLPGSKTLKVIGATHNNLKNLSVEFPLETFIAVTGVSGSGKSSLVNDILLKALEKHLHNERMGKNGRKDEEEKGTEEQDTVGQHKKLTGLQHVTKVIDIDQTPIGRTPRSNPATYIKLFDEIRSLYAQMPQSKVRGYQPGRFSFNVPGGRCEACDGNGANKLEMDFLADLWVPCPVCEGRRFNRETLQVRFKDKNIQEVLEMDVQQALDHFSEVPRVRTMLQTLHDVGLDYLKLGQPSPTLSGGEAQRIKLARELCHPSSGHTLYILDEPTTGLHFDDIKKLLRVLHSFVEQGHTVIVIEHNLDVIKTADWVIDLGPEGGAGGGELVCAGTPEQVATELDSFTGQALKPVFQKLTLTARTKDSVSKRKGKPKIAQATHVEVVSAAQHNLKNISVAFPREAMTVCSGPSGSGKSTFAIDTVYAEGQRRYVESLSSYARQFLGQMQKPKVEHVNGLSPAICIEQKTTSKSPRSTVGTVTEIHDYLRVLFARLGQQYCPKCEIPIGTQSADEVIGKIMDLPEGTKLYLLAPVDRKGQESYEGIWEEIKRSGYVRVRINGKTYPIEELPKIDHRRKHQVEVVVDRIIVRAAQRSRIAEAVEAALDYGRGVILIAHVNEQVPEPKWKVQRFSQHLACEKCGRSFEALNPHHFSFNSPLGWCPTCEGLGIQQGMNPAALIRDVRLPLKEGAISAWPAADDPYFAPFAAALVQQINTTLETPYQDLEPLQQRAILHGVAEEWQEIPPTGLHSHPLRFQYKGLLPAIDEAMRVSFSYRQKLDNLVAEVPCTVCRGSRLREDAAAVRFQKYTLGEVGDMPLDRTLRFFKELHLTPAQQQVAGELFREIVNRLQFLVDVGLDYLNLNRSAPTLSGGEAQRIRLASQIGSGLTGVLYVLDEPTIGLHPRDNRRLLGALQHLRDLGNTLLLVEHDREVIAAADYLLDFGPGAGDGGGNVVAQGTPAKVKKSKDSLTGQYLSGIQAIPVPTNRRIAYDTAGIAKPPSNGWLIVKGARLHNLRNIDVPFPLGCLVAVTGVSGSGKSSLVNEVLYNALARKLHRARTTVGGFDDILGLDQVDKVINVDQAPLGNSPSSNPATYSGVYDLIRNLFAQLPEAKVRGYQPRRFSFNMPGGRCEACEGMGQKKIEMHFLPDVWVECEICHGTRFAPETLAVRYKDHSIADVLKMRIRQALELFDNIPRIRTVLQTLADVGLDYVQLGQAAPTLSGGEAQRVKLAAELARPNTGRTMYILDEPTTGLHFDDIRKLLEVLHRLVDLGNTVIVVEHNLDVMKSADWVIDLGPEAGADGGTVVAAGTPEHIVSEAKQKSHTAMILQDVLANGPHTERARYDPYRTEVRRTIEIDIEQVGKAAQMPWTLDGRRWHTQDRMTLTGKACKWEGTALAWLVDHLERNEVFGPTNWNSRTMVEIPAIVKSRGWFLHASTCDEKLLWLTFRLARNTFKAEELANKLGLKPLNDTPGVKVFGNEPRVRVKNEKGPWQSVELGVHWQKEIDTTPFRQFLTKAITSFENNLDRMQTDVESFMPWKINGQQWHLSTKGFPPGRTMLWDVEVLRKLAAIVQELGQEVELNWNLRDAIHVRPIGATKFWSRWKTKDPLALECHFVGKRGQFNLARLEPFGMTHSINRDKESGDLLCFRFRTVEQLKVMEFKQLLTECLKGFQELYGPRTRAEAS